MLPRTSRWPTAWPRRPRWRACTRTGSVGWRSRGCWTGSWSSCRGAKSSGSGGGGAGGLWSLPSSEERERRRASHRGLTAPELATLMAYTKIVLESELGHSDAPDDPYLLRDLIGYFPRPLQERYADQMREHRLHREIITTVAVNRFVDTAGITCFHRLSLESGVGPAEVILAHTAARVVFRAAELDEAIRRLDHQIDADTQTALRLEVRTLVERATRWLLNRRRPIDIQAVVDELADGVRTVV